MGIFDINQPRPRVTEKEFKKIRAELSGHGFTMKEKDRIAEIFRGDMFEIKEKEKGIDEQEIDNGIAWMKANSDRHRISENKIEILEERLKSRLRGIS